MFFVQMVLQHYSTTALQTFQFPFLTIDVCSIVLILNKSVQNILPMFRLGLMATEHTIWVSHSSFNNYEPDSFTEDRTKDD